ncbi:MAG: hypothetical protein EBS50_12270 [Sphingomonadaceae bacterium]|nr:hypothetical protein [Sphingomonadaceae bacterium]
MSPAERIAHLLSAAGAEMRACCDRLDESNAKRIVIETGMVALDDFDGWQIAERVPADHIGYVIHRSTDGASKFWAQDGRLFARAPDPRFVPDPLGKILDDEIAAHPNWTRD